MPIFNFVYLLFNLYLIMNNCGKIVCNNRELQLLGTLNGGQSFRWSHNKEHDEWTGVFSKTVWKLKQENDHLHYEVLGSLRNNINQSKNCKSNAKRNIKDSWEMVLNNYFRLDTVLSEYYKEWAQKDSIFKNACQQFYGIRMLNQEPVENLFSFICSQNNHINRISSLVEKLCTNYGDKICDINGVTYYSFPEVDQLADPKIEMELRNLGFGYRAKFIQKSAEQIVEWGKDMWFDNLKNMKYDAARRELMKLHGIGPKVADCICLMSLQHLESVPVDTHVYQIASQNYLPHLRGKKSVTEKMYAEIGDHFRNLYGPLAGWAHTVLFCADLKKFQQSETCEDKNKSRKRKKT